MDDRKLRLSYDALLAQRGSLDRGDCPTANQIAALFDRSVDEAPRLQTLDHIMSCLECREDFESARADRGQG